MSSATRYQGGLAGAAQRVWLTYATFWRGSASLRQWALITVVVATLLGSTYRLRDLRESLQFLGDQGRDAIVAYEILQGDIVLLGPTTSVGSMYLGPLYYYFMSPWLFLSRLDPIGPAVAVAVLGIATIPALYWIGREWVGERAAGIATLLYASAPAVVEYTRFSWNPNPAPIVMLLMMHAVWRAWKGKSFWWIVAVFWGSVIIQLHYVALLAAAPAGLVWMADLLRALRQRDSQRLRSLLGVVLAGSALLLVSITPLVFFDLRGNGSLRAGFADFLIDSDGETKRSFAAELSRILREQHGRAMHVLFEIWGGKDWFAQFRQLNTFLLSVYVGLAAFALGSEALGTLRAKPASSAARLGEPPQSRIWFLVMILATNVLGLAWYSGTVYNHYISYLFPFSYLATAWVIVWLARRLPYWFGVIPAFVLFAYVSVLSVLPSSLRYMNPIGWSVDDSRATAEQILAELPEGRPYALANLSEVRDYRGLSYRYFLTISEHPPVPFQQEAQAELLVIIAETPRDPDQVLSSPVYEISSFPRGEYRTLDIPNGPRLFIVERAQASDSDRTWPEQP